MNEIAIQLLHLCRRQGIKIATAESCTGGMIAAALTAIAGSSDVFDRGFVTYSNEAKTDMLGVPPALIAEHGAVSEPVARAMVLGAITHSQAQLAVSVTGIAGPSGGSDAKPVGTVFIAVALQKMEPQALRCHFDGDRAAVREAAMTKAIAMMMQAVS